MEKLKRRFIIAAALILTMLFAAISLGAIVRTEDAQGQPETYREAAEPEQTPEPEAPEEPAAEPEEPEKVYTYYELGLSDEMQEYAQDVCEKYEFPYYDIIAAMIQTESGCTEKIVSKTNDYGYMKINACNHQWLEAELGITDFLDGKQNIEAGVYIIQRLYHKYEDIGKALVAYNCGEGGAADLWRQGIYSTQYSRYIQQQAAELVERPAEEVVA